MYFNMFPFLYYTYFIVQYKMRIIAYVRLNYALYSWMVRHRARENQLSVSCCSSCNVKLQQKSLCGF